MRRQPTRSAANPGTTLRRVRSNRSTWTHRSPWNWIAKLPHTISELPAIRLDNFENTPRHTIGFRFVIRIESLPIQELAAFSRILTTALVCRFVSGCGGLRPDSIRHRQVRIGCLEFRFAKRTQVSLESKFTPFRNTRVKPLPSSQDRPDFGPVQLVS